ncbi:MAG: prephenate dehydrogenase [Victivallaceae bacterium]|nr:prephenate dehydrogenase [Victivallaceae bacterium]
MKTVGIVGCGLIGGSFAKAIKANLDCRVVGFDRDESALCLAELEKAIDGRLTEKNLAKCDLVLIALPPQGVLDFLHQYGKFIGKGAVVVDCAGVKRRICPEAWKTAAENGFVFVGGHPMAGKEKSGFGRSTETLFSGASMLLAFEGLPEPDFLEKFKAFFLALGFTRVVPTTPEKHDRIIAYTSQLAHALSASFVCSATADEHAGYSAGSFRDMIRVASVDPGLWSDLFLDNGDFLAKEVRTLIKNLASFADALETKDRDALVALLEKGAARKAKIESLRTLRAAAKGETAR